MLQAVDDILNNYTMYRVVVYGLGAFIAVAALLAGVDTIAIPLNGLLLSVVVLTASSYVTNKIFSVLCKVPSNAESWLISALILVCILPPATSVQRAAYMALAAALAMVSKYLLVYRGSNIFNPAAFGAFVVSVCGWLPATWWVATPWLAPFAAFLALIVLRKQRRFRLFVAFGAAATGMLLLLGSGLRGAELGDTLRIAVLSWPIIFFGSIMLTEPSTLPRGDTYRILFGIVIGLLFASQLHTGRWGTTPQAVLLLGNVLVLLAVPTYGLRLTFKAIKQLSPDIFELSFDRPRRFAFSPGQYMELTLPHRHMDGRGNRRTFSIASASNEPEIRLAFRHYVRSSSMKTALLGLPPASRVRIAHIDGEFTLPADPLQPLLCIAGGIGITPFHSMITSLTERHDIVLLYLAATPESFVYKDDFAAAEAQGVHTQYIIDRIAPAELRRAVPDIANRLVYLSGPDAMVRSYVRTLKTLGLSNDRIKTDRFTGY